MQRFKQSWYRWTFPFLALAAFTIWYCDPGSSLNPQQPVVPVAKLTYTNNLPHTPMQPGDTGIVNVTVTDSSASSPLANVPLSISSGDFSVLRLDSSKLFTSPTTVPSSGMVSVRIVPRGAGNVSVRGILTLSAGNGNGSRTVYDSITVSEKPVTPLIEAKYPAQIGLLDSPVVEITIKDSAQGNPLQYAVVDLSGTLLQLYRIGSSATVSKDTTDASGKVTFRIHADAVGTGSIHVVVNTAGGRTASSTLTISVTNVPVNDRPRSMTFIALRPTLKADGTDSTQLKVVVKDAATNNPLEGERIVFTATGGLVSSEAVTDKWGAAFGILVSERVNKSVVVTATMVRTGVSAQQVVVFDGINIAINASKRVIMRDSIVNVTFTLTDANGSPMSGDTLELVGTNLFHGFGQRLPNSPTRDSILVQVDTRGQYKTTVTAQTEVDVVLDARALGARTLDTVSFTNKSLTFVSNKSSIVGDGVDQATLTATLVDGNGAAISGVQLRWTTTFGTFTTTPFTNTNASGSSSIVLRSAKGSGLAIVNVEAQDNTGKLIASGNITVRVTALPVRRMTLKVTPDNIPVKIGEATMVARAYDSLDNVMDNVLVGFRVIKGAGGGDEYIAPPVSYSLAGAAQATFKAGGVISFYQSVKLAAVALDIAGTDTLVVASSDTVGLTISGPPEKVSIGANILKGLNPNDGTFALPTAAVVTDVNGNLVADGTPVNFSVQPIIAHYAVKGVRGLGTYWWDYGIIDTIWQALPWTDYNNNVKWDPGEDSSKFNTKNPYRGEDRDGDGSINFGEPYIDINSNGQWDSIDAEPVLGYRNVYDTSGAYVGIDTVFVDFNHDGRRTSLEPYTDYNANNTCDCWSGPGGGLIKPKKNAAGRLYEVSYYNSPANRPYPGFASIGIDRQVGTVDGKALTKILYVQSDAMRITVRITAESNGIRNAVDVWLPIILDGGK